MDNEVEWTTAEIWKLNLCIYSTSPLWVNWEGKERQQQQQKKKKWILTSWQSQNRKQQQQQQEQQQRKKKETKAEFLAAGEATILTSRLKLNRKLLTRLDSQQREHWILRPRSPTSHEGLRQLTMFIISREGAPSWRHSSSHGVCQSWRCLSSRCCAELWGERPSHASSLSDLSVCLALIQPNKLHLIQWNKPTSAVGTLHRHVWFVSVATLWMDVLFRTVLEGFYDLSIKTPSLFIAGTSRYAVIQFLVLRLYHRPLSAQTSTALWR